MTDRQIIDKLKNIYVSQSHIIDDNEEHKLEIDNRKKRWITYFRNNIEIYIEKRMNFHSFGYQNFSYHLMNEASNYIEVSTRGVGKSLRCIVYAAARALLYPYSKIGVCAAQKNQSDEDFQTAFMHELVNQYSPFMKWLYKNGLIKTREAEKGYVVEFWNGSIIYFFACIESSRGLHISTLIGEEVRLIPKNKWDSIAVPMLVPRQPPFKSLPEYIEQRQYDEPTQTVMITSNMFRTEWFNNYYNKTFTNYFKDRLNENRVLSFDVFLALKHGLRTKPWLMAQKVNMNDIAYRAEILNETIGETDGAYFTLEQFRGNQVLKKAFIPANEKVFKSNPVYKNRPKQENEKRLLFVDFAFIGSHGDVINDKTCIGCMSLIFKDGKMFRNVEYLETHSGNENDYSMRRIREIYFEYEADYIVFDINNGGQVNFNDFTKPYDNPYRSSWNNHGFTLANEEWIQITKKDKLDSLRERVVDPQAIPCLIPISGSSEMNSIFWQDLSLQLKNGTMSFLIDELEFESNIGIDKKYIMLDSESKAEIRSPYVQTTILIGEAINLTASWSSGNLKLSETGRNTKDMIVSLSYGNYIASKIESYYQQKDASEEFNALEYKLIF